MFDFSCLSPSTGPSVHSFVRLSVRLFVLLAAVVSSCRRGRLQCTDIRLFAVLFTRFSVNLTRLSRRLYHRPLSESPENCLCHGR